MTRRTILAVLQKTYRKEEFVRMLHDKGIDTVFRLTDTGRIYGATFIDHRTGCVLNGSRMGKELSANALQEHFTLPYAGEQPDTVHTGFGRCAAGCCRKPVGKRMGTFIGIGPALRRYFRNGSAGGSLCP